MFFSLERFCISLQRFVKKKVTYLDFFQMTVKLILTVYHIEYIFHKYILYLNIIQMHNNNPTQTCYKYAENKIESYQKRKFYQSLYQIYLV